MRHRIAFLCAILSPLNFVLVACNGDELAAPEVGTAAITITTIGAEPDPDGYTYQIDTQHPQPTGSSASFTAQGLASGDHSITIGGLAANCAVVGGNPRSFSIATGRTTAVEIQVTCSSTTGTVAIAVVTDGESVDVDGYLLAIDGAEAQRVPTNGTASVPLLPGNYRLELREIASNCNVAGQNPRNVMVTVRVTVGTSFRIHCLPASGAKIAFASYVNFSSDILIMNPDGSGRRNLTNRRGLDLSPAWSPDGTKIAFIGGTDTFESYLFIVNADGSNQTKLTPAAYVVLAWSPGGRRIAFLDTAGGGPQVFLINADGSDRQQLTHGLTLSVHTLSWSPDGQRLLIGRSHPSRIVLVNVDGTGETDLTRPGEFESDSDASWSPDGHTIAFLRRSAPPPHQEFPIQNLWLLDSDGTKPRNVSGFTFDDVDYFVDSYGWAPDGDRLAFTHGLGLLTFLRSNGSDWTTRKFEGMSIQSPAWSPDGSKIMLTVSSAHFTHGIGLINPDGSGLTLLSSGDVYEEAPVWQP